MASLAIGERRRLERPKRRHGTDAAFSAPSESSTILRQCSACAPASLGAPSRLGRGISPSPSSPVRRSSSPVFIHSHPRAGCRRRNQSHASYVYRRAFPGPPSRRVDVSVSASAFWVLASRRSLVHAHTMSERGIWRESVADGNAASSSYPRRPRDRGVGPAFCISLPRTVSLRLRRRTPMVRLRPSPGRFSRDTFLPECAHVTRPRSIERASWCCHDPLSAVHKRSHPPRALDREAFQGWLKRPEGTSTLPAGRTSGGHSRYLFAGAHTRCVLPAIYASSVVGGSDACLEEPGAGIIAHTCDVLEEQSAAS